MKRRELLTIIPLGFAGYVHAVTTPEIQGMYSPAPSPEDNGPLSIRYTRKVRDMLRWIRETQAENLLEASHTVARTVTTGGTCWCIWDMGHSATMDVYPGRNGEPEIFTQGYDRDKSRQGDLLLTNLGEYPPFDDVTAKNIVVIGGPTPWSGDAKGSEFLLDRIQKMVVRPYAHLWIETNITTVGAVMSLPGMPAPMGPVSGVIGMTTYWMILADACRVLARDGLSVPVKGDDPPLEGASVPWVSLDAPLMDDYYDDIIRQIELIGAELGAVREMARMAVDSVLAGGKVFVYSRYQMGLCIEASYRRGGMLLTRGLYDDGGKVGAAFSDFTGTDKDTVIMGLAKPDDEIDLKYLDLFRSRKMKVASLGPATRNFAVPEGRTIPKETDVHAGGMCDTYGLFAVPGFTRNVCPTSGVLLNQLFWAICMETAEEIMRRTGDTPAVLFSSALKWGRSHNRSMEALYARRGY